jgi:TP901 family phage tail tape measure protein
MTRRLSTDEIQLNITINSNKAKLELGELDKRAMKLREEMKGLKKGTEEYAAKSRELAQVKSRMEELRKQVGLTGLSMRQLSQRARELSLIKQHLTPGTAEFKRVDAELQKINARMRELRTGSQQTGVSLNGLAQGFNKYFGIITAFSASILGTVLSFRKLVEQYNEYEKSVSNLSALTGLTGSELEWLSDKAKEMSTSMVEGNIRITSSANDIVNAYTVVGSKMPELLQDQEALLEVTKQAMILAKAGNIELNVAVDALTNTMNQFRLPAEEAANVINVIAAGSKLGAADIDFIGNSITRFGAAAMAMGVDVTQSVAMIEVLGKAGLDAQKAGTGLKTFLLKSAQQADEFNVTVVGLDQALHNLKDANFSAAEMTKMFGLEAYIAAQSMLTNIDIYDDLISKLDGTKIAYEMAAVNSANNASALEQARNRAALLRMELGEKLAPALTFSTNAFSYLVKAIMHVIDNWEKYRNILLLTIGILAAHYYRVLISTAVMLKQNLALQAGIGLKIKEAVIMQALIIKEAALAGWRVKGTIATKAATAAQRVFNAVVSQFPGFAILAAILAIIGAIKAYDKYSAKAVEREKEKKRLHDENNTLLENAKTAIDDLSESQKILNTLTAEEKSRLYEHNQEKLNSLKLDLEQMKVNKLKAEQNAAGLTLMQKITAALLGLNGASYTAASSIKNQVEAGMEFNEAIKEMENSIKSLVNGMQQLDDIFTAEARANAILGDSISALEEKLNLYRLALKHAKIGSEEYQRLQELSTETQKQLTAAMERGQTTIEKATNAYDELNKKISEAQKHLAHYVTLGDLTSAQAWHNILRGLLAQKFVLDQLITAGGDMKKMLDDFKAAQYAAGDALFASLDADIDKLISDELNKLSDEAENATEETRKARLESYNEEMRMQLDLKKAWFNASLDMAHSIASATMDIYSNSLNAQTNAQLAALDKRRDAELQNENLTAQQREAIQEKYRKQEAKIKADAFKKQKTADIIMSIINTALAVTKALTSAPPPGNLVLAAISGAAGLAQTAVIASQPVPQFATGRYDVTGATDNQLYRNVPFTGPARTGIYRGPALVAERGDELIIDNPTLRRVRVNYPEALRAIEASRVPQYAAGRYNSADAAIPDKSESSEILALVIATINSNSEAINKLIHKLDKDIIAKLNYQDIRSMDSKVDDIESSTRI